MGKLARVTVLSLFLFACAKKLPSQEVTAKEAPALSFFHFQDPNDAIDLNPSNHFGCDSVGKNGEGRPLLMIGSPVRHQVFQRGSDQHGPLEFYGNVDSEHEVNCVEIKMRSRTTGQESPWIKITDKVVKAGEQFRSTLGAQQGSYTVTVRGVTHGYTGTEYTIDNVGIGEVFITAGQSNSSFAGDVPLQSSLDGMVSFFDGTYWKTCKDSTVNSQTGAHESAMARIDPYAAVGNLGQPGAGRGGGSPWCPFGDTMYARWGVPVAIAPLGVGGTNVYKWLKYNDPNAQDIPPYVSFASSSNQPDANNRSYAAAQIAGAYGYYNFDIDFAGNPYMDRSVSPWVVENDTSGLCPNSKVYGSVNYNSCMRKGFLYARLVSRLKYFAERGGGRAVLWHQGESDVTYQGTASDSNYYSRTLRALILNSRAEAGFLNVPWLVSYVGVTAPQWRSGYTSSVAPTFGSNGLFAPNTIPTRANYNAIRGQQRQVIVSTYNVFEGVDSDQLSGVAADGHEIYRSEISFPHFNEHGLKTLGVAWANSVSKAFGKP